MLQWYTKNSGLCSSQTINEVMDVKDMKCKSLINRAIVITDVVIMVNTKQRWKIERLLKEKN